jgi:hypothetical protein
VLGTGAELHLDYQQSILGWFGAAFAFRHLAIAWTGLTNIKCNVAHKIANREHFLKS